MTEFEHSDTANTELALQRYVEQFERLSEGTLDQLCQCFSSDARFKDPFNDVRGTAAIRNVFAHSLSGCNELRFEISVAALDGSNALIEWICVYRLRRYKPQLQRRIEGASRVSFERCGLVSEHIDYWDPAEWVYSQVPVYGPALAWLRKKLQA